MSLDRIYWSDFFQPITHMIRSTDSFFAQASDWLRSEAETARTGRGASRKVECPFFCRGIVGGVGGAEPESVRRNCFSGVICGAYSGMLEAEVIRREPVMPGLLGEEGTRC